MGATAKSLCQVGMEATPGVAVAAKHMMPGPSKQDLKITFDQPMDYRGSYDAYFENIQTLVRVADFQLNGEYYPETALWVWLMAVNNAPTIFSVPALGGNPAYYGWVINPGDTLNTATIEEFDGTASWQYPYSCAQKVELSFTPSKAVDFVITGISQDRLAMGTNPTSDGQAPNNALTALSMPTDFPLKGATAKLTIDPLPSTSLGSATAQTPSSALAKPTTLAGSATGSGGTIPANTYYYKVTAFNDWGETEASNEPAGIVVTAGQKVNLTWTAPATGTPTGYRIWRGTSAGNETLLAYVLGNIVAWTDDGATNYRINTQAAPPTTNSTPLSAPGTLAGTATGTGGTLGAGTYYYKATAFNAWGETVASSETTQITVASGNKVNLTWVQGAGGTPVGYKIYRTAANGAAGTEVYLATVGNVLAYTDDGSATGTSATPPTTNGTLQFTGTMSNINVLDAKFTIELAQKEIYGLNAQGTFTRVYRGRRKVTAQATIDFLSVNEYNNFKNFVYQVFQFVFTGKPLATGATVNEQLYFTVPMVYVTFTVDKTKENAQATVMGDAVYDPNLGFSHQVRAQCLASAASAY